MKGRLHVPGALDESLMKKVSSESVPPESYRKAESCPQCGSPSALFRSSTDINRKTTREVFHYYRCLTCDLIFMANIPGLKSATLNKES